MYDYSCLMAMPSDKRLIKKIKRFGSFIPDELIFNNKSGEYGREEEPHVTILYGLITENVHRVVKNIPVNPFKVTLGEVGRFESDEYDVIKLSAESNRLREINRIVKKLPNDNKYPNYDPHLTLAYVEKEYDDSLLSYANPFYGKAFVCQNLVFSTPSGKRYNFSLLDGTINHAV